MDERTLIEAANRVVRRKLVSESELLTLNEMNTISPTDIRTLAERLPLELGLEIQWYYYENRKHSNQQLLEETEEQIKEFEILYGCEFETNRQ